MSFEHRAGLFGAVASDSDGTGSIFKFDDYFTLEPQAARRLRDVVCKDVDPVRRYLCHLESEGVRRWRFGRRSWGEEASGQVQGLA